MKAVENSRETEDEEEQEEEEEEEEQKEERKRKGSCYMGRDQWRAGGCEVGVKWG